jgi:hypothetical protein
MSSGIIIDDNLGRILDREIAHEIALAEAMWREAK